MSSPSRGSDPREATFALALDALDASAHAPEATVRPPEAAVAGGGPDAHGHAGVWEEIGLLGQGGMGTVHAAQDRVLERVVALKRPRVAGDADALVAEARTLARMDHPNVVPVHALARDDAGLPVVVMKRVNGRRWTDLLREGRDLERDVDITLEVADALRYAHSRRVFHRDVKPDNVMVGEFGEVYLMDWGCAASGENLVTTVLCGTPSYLAPEMLQPGAPVGAATDVFLLGATLHRALTGQGRHRGASVREVLASARRAAPASYPPEVPSDLGAIVNRACAADPAERYPTVEAFAAALRGFRAHREAAGLADAALAGADALRAAIAARRPEADAAFAELRGELRSALRAWAGNARARAGLAALSEDFVAWKVEVGEFGAAEAALDGLLDGRRAHWRDRLEAARAAWLAREAERRAHDLDVAARERLIAAGIVLGGGALAVPGFAAATGSDFTPLQLVYAGAFSLGLVLVAVAVTWRGVRQNQASLRQLASVVALATGGLLHRGLAWAAGTPAPETLRAECVWCWCLLGVIGLFSEPGLLVSGMPFLLGAVAITAWPEHAGVIFPLAAFPSVVIAVVVLRERARRAGARPTAP